MSDSDLSEFTTSRSSSSNESPGSSASHLNDYLNSLFDYFEPTQPIYLPDPIPWDEDESQPWLISDPSPTSSWDFINGFNVPIGSTCRMGCPYDDPVSILVGDYAPILMNRSCCDESMRPNPWAEQESTEDMIWDNPTIVVNQDQAYDIFEQYPQPIRQTFHLTWNGLNELTTNSSDYRDTVFLPFHTFASIEGNTYPPPGFGYYCPPSACPSQDTEFSGIFQSVRSLLQHVRYDNGGDENCDCCNLRI